VIRRLREIEITEEITRSRDHQITKSSLSLLVLLVAADHAYDAAAANDLALVTNPFD
jgi:hypothetical protein